MKTSFNLINHFFDNINDILTPAEFIDIGTRQKESISNIPAVFDIEASSFYLNNEKCSCMYAFVFGINGRCIRGRSWDDFMLIINECIKYYGLNINKRLIIYVHNLEYEFQFIKHLFTWSTVFSVEQRRPLYAITTSGIEFRCSYLLSGLSLAKVGDNLLKYKVNKLVGDLDYNLIRHSKTPLSDKEWDYILHDGLVVMAFIQEELDRLGDISKLPKTKTGYVRNLCRDKCSDNKQYRKLISSLTMDPVEYKQLKLTYAGGFTHANHNFVGRECKTVSSFDFTSSYPAVMLSEKFPMSKAHYIELKSKKEFDSYINKYCCMFQVKFINIVAKVDYEHYISKSRCIECKDFALDNGRVISASELVMCLTEVDFKIISSMYEWESFAVSNFRYYYKDYLPKEIINIVLELYKNKTTLKNVAGKEAEYMASKGMINSVYGMSVTDPCKDTTVYDNVNGWYTESNDLEALIKKYNTSHNRTLFYPWGVWITAYSRSNLFSGINEFKDDYIYSDTDSLKVFNKDKHINYINDYNKAVKAKIKACLEHYRIDPALAEPKTIKGVSKPLGVWDYEGTYTRFKTLGAKRYMYEDEGVIHITISGVKKSAGVNYLYSKYKSNDNIFKAFQDGMIFPATYIDHGVEVYGSGKLTHTYIDVLRNDKVTDYLGTTYTFKEFSGVHMEPASYELSLEAMFKEYVFGNSNYMTK